MTPRPPSWRRSCRKSAGVGQVIVGGSALPGVRIELNPSQSEQVRHRLGTGAHRSGRRECQHAQRGISRTATRAGKSAPTIRSSRPIDYEPLVIAYHNGVRGAHLRRRRGRRFGGGLAQCRLRQRQAVGAGDRIPPARRQHHRHRRSDPRRSCRNWRHPFRAPSICAWPWIKPSPSALRCRMSRSPC